VKISASSRGVSAKQLDAKTGAANCGFLLFFWEQMKTKLHDKMCCGNMEDFEKMAGEYVAWVDRNTSFRND
jgi:hypothetical protein